MANSENLIHFLSSAGQLCNRHDMVYYHLERCAHCSERKWLAITRHTLSPRVSQYFVVFIVPSMSVNVPTPSKVMHPHNTTTTRGPPYEPTHSGRQISSAFLQTCTRLS